MKQQIVTAISVASFVAFAFGASAQSPNSPQGGTAPSAPMAQPSGPSGASSAETSRPEGAQSGQASSTQEGVTERNKAAETGNRDQMNRDRKSAESGDKDQIDRDRKSAESGDKDQMDRGRKPAESGDKDQMDRDRKSADRTAARIDSGQKEKVRTYFSQHRPTAHRIEKSKVTVSIGAPLPAGVALAPLPPDVIVVAGDCPLQYFIWGDDVVLVDSCSREVVDVIPNIG